MPNNNFRGSYKSDEKKEKINDSGKFPSQSQFWKNVTYVRPFPQSPFP
jgi:hypothetical protein